MPIVADAAVAIRGDLSKFSGDLKKAEGQTQSLGQKLNAALSPKALIAGAGIGLGLQQVIGFLGDTVSAASNLEQATGAVESVLGDASAALTEFGETSAEEFGLSKRAVNEMGAVMAAQLQGMGYDAKAAAEETINLEKRAADMSATFGGSVSDAVQAISALMRGERDTIEKYGVTLKDADIQARILALGLDTSTTAASNHATAVASLSLFYEKTAKTQGAFARESDTLAGAQARLGAEMEDVSAEIGQELLPVFLELATFAKDVLVPALRTVIDVAKEGAKWIGAVYGAVPDDVGESAFDRLRARFAEVPVVAADTAALVREGLAAGSKEVDKGAERAFKPIHERMSKAARQAAAEARALPADISQALVQGMEDVESGMTALTDLMENSLSDAAKVARLKGVLASQELAAGLNDERADVRAAAMAIRDDALHQLHLLTTGAADAAVDAGTTFSEQLRLQAVKAGVAATAVMTEVRNSLQFPAGPAGATIGSDWIKSMVAAIKAGKVDMLTTVTGIRNIIGHSLPSEGPLQHPERGGYSIGEAFMQKGLVASIRAGLGDVQAALPTLAANAMLPSFAPLAAGPSSGLGTTPGTTINNNYLNIEGEKPVVSSAVEIAEQAARLGRFKG